MTDAFEPEVQPETPPLIAYRALVYEEAQRLFQFAVLLVEDPRLAAEVVQRAFERTWTALRRRQLYMDIDEQVYWNVVREVAQRLARSKQVRGYQPPTTGDDRHITAVGVLEGFAPEQRAAVYLAVRFGTGYQFAGAAAGIGESRARDVVYAARQEYREAREPVDVVAPECARMAPLLSARVEGQLREQERTNVEAHLGSCPVCTGTLRSYEDFSAALKELPLPRLEGEPVEQALAIPAGRPDRPRVGFRRFVAIANGPIALIALVAAGFFVYTRWFTPPPIETGVGRTSDLVYARAADGGGIMVLESGSGRELNRLPAGALAPSGYAIYAESAQCGPAECKTTLTRTDTATGETSPIASLDGHLHVIAVDRRERAYLVDQTSGWDLLVAVNLREARVEGTARGPDELSESFGPRRPLLAPGGRTLFTLARPTSGVGVAVLTTDLAPLRVNRWITLTGLADLGVGMTLSADGNRLFVYFPADGTLQEVDAPGGRVLRSLGLRAEEQRPEGSFIPAEGTLIAADNRGEYVYCVLPTGGVAVVSQDSLELVREVATERRYRAIGVSSDGGALYALGFDGSYRVFDPRTGAERVNRAQVRAEDILQVNVGE